VHVFMKGILLAGGKGSRLSPVTKAVSKQLLPVFDKPMIYYPLSILFSCAIRDILLVTAQDEAPRFQKLLGDGSFWGASIQYVEQNEPKGLAEALLLGKEFVGNEPVALILGDNLFYGPNLARVLQEGKATTFGATLVGYPMEGRADYGMVSLDEQKCIVRIEEKPTFGSFSHAVTGLYFYGPGVMDRAENLLYSDRKELEITDLNRTFLADKTLRLSLLEKEDTWFDMGTFETLYQASSFVRQKEIGEKTSVGSLEGIARKSGWIS